MSFSKAAIEQSICICHLMVAVKRHKFLHSDLYLFHQRYSFSALETVISTLFWFFISYCFWNDCWLKSFIMTHKSVRHLLLLLIGMDFNLKEWPHIKIFRLLFEPYDVLVPKYQINSIILMYIAGDKSTILWNVQICLIWQSNCFLSDRFAESILWLVVQSLVANFHSGFFVHTKWQQRAEEHLQRTCYT